MITDKTGHQILQKRRCVMNLINFLKKTETLTAQYSKEQLILFIHELGRVFPEEQRADFLKIAGYYRSFSISEK